MNGDRCVMNGARPVRPDRARCDLSSEMAQSSTMSDAKKPKVMERLSRLGDDDGTFDFEYWQQFTPEERLGAIWQATLDWAAMRGIDEAELRLKRTVVGIKRA